MGGSLRIVIGRVPKGNRRDHNIVRVSSFASKELSWHERSCIVCLRVRRKLKLALLKRAQPFLYMLSDVTLLAESRILSVGPSLSASPSLLIRACRSEPVDQSLSIRACRSEPVGRSQPLAGKSECHMIPSVTC